MLTKLLLRLNLNGPFPPLLSSFLRLTSAFRKLLLFFVCLSIFAFPASLMKLKEAPLVALIKTGNLCFLL